MVVRGEAMQCKAKDSGMCLVSGGVVVGGCDSWSPEWPGLLVVGSSLPAQAPRRRGSRQQSEHAERESERVCTLQVGVGEKDRELSAAPRRRREWRGVPI